MNWTDIVVIAVIGFFAFHGYRKGMVVTLIRLIKTIASLIVANLFHRPFVDLVLSSTGHSKENVANEIRELIQGYISVPANLGTKEQISEVFRQIPIPGFARDFIENELGNQAVKTISQAVEVIANQLADIALYSLGFVVLAILAFFALTIIEKMSRLITALPLVKQVNNLGGFLIGLLQGLLVVMFLIVVVNTFQGAEWARSLRAEIDQSLIAHQFQTFNFIYFLFDAFKAKGA
ncbi:MAG: CvpA family protein [Bacillota bacterium]|nr:CvpA family protein [Bacillota bacterium]